MPFPTPHLDKLTKTLANEKLPKSDATRLEGAIKFYQGMVEEARCCPNRPQTR